MATESARSIPGFVTDNPLYVPPDEDLKFSSFNLAGNMATSSMATFEISGKNCFILAGW